MQRSTLYSIVSFVGGATISGLATWFLTKKKYEKIAQDEIDSVKARFTIPREPKVEELPVTTEKESKPKKSKKKEAEKALNKPDLDTLSKTIKDEKYVNYSNVPELEPKKDDIRVITPNDFGEKEDYDQVNLTLYADGILARDDGDVIVEAKDIIGDALEYMGKFEDDAVHACNFTKGIYYEVLVDNRKYEEATKKKPFPDDGEGK